MHGEKDRRLRETLARDWDLNGIDDITEEDDNANDNGAVLGDDSPWALQFRFQIHF